MALWRQQVAGLLLSIHYHLHLPQNVAACWTTLLVFWRSRVWISTRRPPCGNTHMLPHLFHLFDFAFTHQTNPEMSQSLGQFSLPTDRNCRNERDRVQYTGANVWAGSAASVFRTAASSTNHWHKLYPATPRFSQRLTPHKHNSSHIPEGNIIKGFSVSALQMHSDSKFCRRQCKSWSDVDGALSLHSTTNSNIRPPSVALMTLAYLCIHSSSGGSQSSRIITRNSRYS